ncbi:RNA-protein complex protein Nop10 [Ignicoccus islandicus]|uniref:RNA-protein complex protein Nop10 n=1 Tax=Ignicoccus islandicus TaxID=54259 RepID=UPI000946320C|nr:RNA-protein complex protein Nop10 [Ignicoccus islandicus]
MKWLMRQCPNCGRYTFKETCPVCGTPTKVPHPPRFSPEDKYVKYRIMAKYLQNGNE